MVQRAIADASSMQMEESSEVNSLREPDGAGERKRVRVGRWEVERPASAVRSRGSDMHNTVDEE